MTDDQLELRLRDWYRAEIPADERHRPPSEPRLNLDPQASRCHARRFDIAAVGSPACAAALLGCSLGALGSGGSASARLQAVLTPPAR